MHRFRFNPRSPWGERRYRVSVCMDCDFVSIHAPRGGSDRDESRQPYSTSDFNPRSPWGERREIKVIQIKPLRFQSTLPVGGATSFPPWYNVAMDISIHAPRGGSDRCGKPDRESKGHFNPRSPWGERLGRSHCSNPSLTFQSTLPVGGATTSAGSIPGIY